ncbi:MAG: nuclear transport factor 2 family protein [Thermoanaerobaculia bacterium]|nr:nuclear transport factor 2 family protein [Thermoanaerobaculia bacterium]
MIVSKLARATAPSLLIVAMCLGSQAYASSLVDDRNEVVETVRQMYVALTNDDFDRFRAVTSSNFYAFDVGKRFDGEELAALVRNAHASGKVYVWEVTEPDVHVDGNSAWVAYVNRGSITDAAGKKELSWLESAVLRKEKGVWRIHFFHSTRVPSE